MKTPLLLQPRPAVHNLDNHHDDITDSWQPLRLSLRRLAERLRLDRERAVVEFAAAGINVDPEAYEMTSDSNFSTTLRSIVEACEADETAIKNIKEKMKERLDDALMVHGIDPGAVRHLLSWRKAHTKDPAASPSRVPSRRGRERSECRRRGWSGRPDLFRRRAQSPSELLAKAAARDAEVPA
ncbi:MAG: hypothetical protein AB7O63_13130 [Reyranellaceae bacterium]